MVSSDRIIAAKFWCGKEIGVICRGSVYTVECVLAIDRFWVYLRLILSRVKCEADVVAGEICKQIQMFSQDR